MKTFFIVVATLASALSHAQVYGCTDPQSLNYNPLATETDGSCVYQPLTLSPLVSTALPIAVVESSGLIMWNGTLLTHNDSNDSKLYELEVDGALAQTHLLPSLNTDWEEISQDDDFIYVGDFGNNAHGNRSNLHILRISKQSLIEGTPVLDTINFNYETQVSFTSVPANTTNFDCEAFIVKGDFIYLFSKEWSAQSTSVYKIPKQPGTHSAQLIGSHNIAGMVTGATYHSGRGVVVLTGYNNLLSPFLMLLTSFKDDDFFGGNKRRVNLSLPLHQIEAVTTGNGLIYYLTNEKLVQLPFVNIPAKLHTIDLTSLISGATLGSGDVSIEDRLIVVDNSAAGALEVKCADEVIGKMYSIIDINGKVVTSGMINSNYHQIPSAELSPGLYLLAVDAANLQVVRFLKK